MKHTLTHSLYCRNRIMSTESSGKYDPVNMILYLKHVFTLLIVLSLFVTCHAQDALTITSLETRVLAKDDGRWFGRATVEQTVDGTIVLCYREASKHTGSDGVIHVRFSKDGGRTWSAPDHTVDNSPIAGFPVSFEGDDAFEPYLYLAPSRRLILHVWRTTGRDHRLGKGTWQTDSSDCGRTWSKLRQVDFVGIEHDDRCYATDDHTIVDGAIYTSLREFIGGEQGWQCKFIQSPDNGESWRIVSEHINVPEHNSVEKGFEYVGEDRIVCIGSEGPGRRHVLQTHSDDLGRTWKRWTDALPETGVSAVRPRATCSPGSTAGSQSMRAFGSRLLIGTCRDTSRVWSICCVTVLGRRLRSIGFRLCRAQATALSGFATPCLGTSAGAGSARDARGSRRGPVPVASLN